MIDDIQINVCAFEEFGKGLIKEMRVSPDGFIQQALQLAYFKSSENFVIIATVTLS